MCAQSRRCLNWWAAQWCDNNVTKQSHSMGWYSAISPIKWWWNRVTTQVSRPRYTTARTCCAKTCSLEGGYKIVGQYSLKSKSWTSNSREIGGILMGVAVYDGHACYSFVLAKISVWGNMNVSYTQRNAHCENFHIKNVRDIPQVCM